MPGPARDHEAHRASGFSVTVLGGFAIARHGAPIALPNPAERLVASLAVNRSPRRRCQLAGTLWPDKEERRALANLRAALWQLNKRCPGLLVADGGGLTIAGGVEVDLWRSLDWCDAVLGEAAVVAPPPVGPLAQPELLPTWSDEWLAFARQFHRLQWLQALVELAGRMLEAGDCTGALRCGLYAIGADALHEQGHEVVIAALIAGGNRVEAIRHYRSLRAFLASELSLPPSPRIEALIASITGPGPADAAAPARARGAGATVNAWG